MRLQKKAQFKDADEEHPTGSGEKRESIFGVVRFTNQRQHKSLAFQDRGLHEAVSKRLKMRVNARCIFRNFLRGGGEKVVVRRITFGLHR